MTFNLAGFRHWTQVTPLRFAQKGVDAVVKAGGIASTIVLVTMNFFMLASVIARYVFGAPIASSDEYLGYMLVGCVMLGLGMGGTESGHLRIEMIANRVTGHWERWIKLATILFGTLWAIFIFVSSLRLWTRNWENHTVGPGAGMPLWIPSATLVVGSGMLLVGLLAGLSRHFSSRR